MNGIWLLFLLGRWSMITGWRDMFMTVPNRNKREFVSVDARLDDLKKDTRSYEMLSRDTGKTMDESVTPSVVTPVSPTQARSPVRSPDFHDYAQNYGQNYAQNYGQNYPQTYTQTNDGRRTPDYFGNTARYHTPARSFSSPRPPQTVTWDARETYARPTSPYTQQQDRYVNPLGMNRI
jgi:hypothetical protein